MDFGTLGKPDLKKKIRELRGAITAAISAGKKSEVKKLRRQVKRMKRRTRELAAAKAHEPAAAAPPSAETSSG